MMKNAISCTKNERDFDAGDQQSYLNRQSVYSAAYDTKSRLNNNYIMLLLRRSYDVEMR